MMAAVFQTDEIWCGQSQRWVLYTELLPDFLLNVSFQAEQADKANQTKARWFFCALSKKKLQEPVVSCALGKLYNKDSIIEFLLDRSTYGDGENICSHVRSLKVIQPNLIELKTYSVQQDVKTLKMTLNSIPLPNGSSELTEQAQFVCPLSMKEMNGSQPFVYISTCGCVFSQAGLRTVTSSKEKGKEKEGSATPPSRSVHDIIELCPNCATKYTQENVVLLNPGPEEEEALRFAVERIRSQESTKKKAKKRKNDSDQGEPPKKKQETTPIINAATVTGTSRAVKSELEKEEAKRKATMSAAVKSLYGTGSTRKETFMTRGTFTRVCLLPCHEYLRLI